MTLTEYLFYRLRELGVGHTFGIPGDFVLPVYAVQEQVGMPTVVCATSPASGSRPTPTRDSADWVWPSSHTGPGR